MSNSVRPHRRQSTRFPHPWDSPGKNTGVGCHFLLQCMKVKSESEVAQSCPTLSDPMDCSPPGSSIHGIFQAGVLVWGAIAFSYDHHSVHFSKVLPRNFEEKVLLFTNPGRYTACLKTTQGGGRGKWRRMEREKPERGEKWGGERGERVNEPGALPAFGSKSEVSGFLLVSSVAQLCPAICNPMD